MIGKFTGTPTPATGFSIGFERIVMLLMERGFKVPGAKEKKVYLLDKKLSNEKLLEVIEKRQQKNEKQDRALTLLTQRKIKITKRTVGKRRICCHYGSL
jgi:hisS: histidyl-tRNA synthetase